MIPRCCAFLIPLILSMLSAPAFAAVDRTVTRGTFTIEFQDLTGHFDQALADRMIDTYFQVYPQEVADYHPGAPRRVIFAIDPSWTGVAAATHHRIMFNPAYFEAHPWDIDTVAHELMHVAQGYSGTEQPGWLVEGIADYARLIYGVDPVGSRWALPPYQPGQSYKDGYRPTARFLDWLETNGHPGIVKQFDAALRDNRYHDRLWRKLTGQTVDQLWIAYTKASRVMVSVACPPSPAQLGQAT